MPEQPNVAVLFFVAHRAMEQRVVQRLRDHGFHLTLAQGRIAARIGPHGTRLTELAEQAQVTKQTAGYLVGQLERGGYVERVPDPSDARARLVRLTPRAAAAQRVARGVEEEVLAEWTALLGARQMRSLERSMAALRAITDPYAER